MWHEAGRPRDGRGPLRACSCKGETPHEGNQIQMTDPKWPALVSKKRVRKAGCHSVRVPQSRHPILKLATAANCGILFDAPGFGKYRLFTTTPRQAGLNLD